MDRIVVVGASLAGLRAAEALRAEGYAGTITVVGDEVHPPYDRPPLSKGVLLGHPTAGDGSFFDIGEALALEWELGVRATRLDLDDRSLELADGRTLGWDGLVLACGTSARRPPFAHDVEGVVTLRTLDDSLELRSRLRAGARLAIVGAGFIGCEVAAAARSLGVSVTLIDMAPLPLLRVVGTDVGTACAELHLQHGVELELGQGVSALETADDGALLGVRLANGRLVEADLALVGVGAVPATEWLAGSGLVLEDGVECDATLHALGASDVVAVGDVARWPNPTFDHLPMRVEHWTHAAESADAGARSLLLGDAAPPFATVPSFWSDQYDVKLQSLGLPALGDECVIVDGDVKERKFVAAYGRQGRVVGAVSMNSPRALGRLRRLIAAGIPMGELPDPLLPARDASRRAPGTIQEPV